MMLSLYFLVSANMQKTCVFFSKLNAQGRGLNTFKTIEICDVEQRTLVAVFYITTRSTLKFNPFHNLYVSKEDDI